MSGPFKMLSFADLMARKKKKKSKGKGPVKSVQELMEHDDSHIQSVPARARSAKAAHSTKRSRPWDDADDDMENVVVKIPRDTTIMADPSGLEKFADKLLLENDEERLASVGPLEALKKATAFNYQALECGLFAQRAFESAQKRIRDLEKSNTSLRKSNGELKVSAGEAAKQAKEAEDSAAKSRAEAEFLQEEIASLKRENGELKGEREALMEQMEGIALEAMLKQRYDLMKEFVSGQYKEWTPEQWIEEFEHGDDDEASEQSGAAAGLSAGDGAAGDVAAGSVGDVQPLGGSPDV